jgi:hypothetical protein
MRKKEDIEKFVKDRKPHVKTSRQMDRRTLDDSFAVMDRTIRTKSKNHKPSAHRIIIRRRMIKIAAAAVIIVGISLLAVLVHQGPGERSVPIVVSPTKMMTAMSLTMAYRRGGMDAVDEQCEKAIRMLGTRPLRLTLGQLLTENNG